MDLVRLAIRQPVTVTVGVILVLLAGLLALGRLPIALTPNVLQTVITVRTFWEGASPQEIERNVVDKQEERLLGLSNLVSMTSSSTQAEGVIRLQFRTGFDKDDALQEVARKLEEVPDYPENVDNPVIEATDQENRDYIAWIVLSTTDPDFDVRQLRDFAIDRIEPALERVPGVAEINVLGGREREVQVRVDPVRMAQRGITPTMFAQALRDVNRDVSAGQVADGKRDWRVRTVSRFRSPEEIEQAVVLDTPGGPIRVGDVAEVVETYKEATSFVRSRGVSVIAINADRELDSNVMAVMDGLQAEIAALNAPGGLLEAEARRLGLNGDIVLEQVYDQTVYVEDALALVRNNIWIGGTLATIVLLGFLRSIRPVAIVALAIPISVIGAVVAMVALGRSINVISLAGMAFAVGMVVDNAIVVLENIYRHLEMGKPPRQAAEEGAREVWGAVLASTLTTVAVFVPILLVEEEAGQLFRDLALAICAAVLLSLVVSMTVIPCAAARVLRPRKAVSEDTQRRGVAAGIAAIVDRLGRRLPVRLAVIAVLTGVSIAGSFFLRPPADYLPTGNRNLVFGLIIPPPGYNLEQMTSIATRVEDSVRPYWEAGRLRGEDPEAHARAIANLPSVPTFDWMTQQPGEPVTPPDVENYFIVSFGGILFHGAIAYESDKVVDLLPLFSHATRSDVLPGVIAFPFQVPLFQLGGSSGSAVKFQLYGPDLDQIRRAAEPLYLELAGAFGFGAIQPDPANFTIEAPELQVRPDLVRLGEIGLTVNDVALAVQIAGDGAIVGEYVTGGETIDLKVVDGAAVDAAYAGDFAALPVATARGGVVSLGAIADVRRVGSPEQIARVNRQRSISFQITPPRGTALEEVVNTIEEIVERRRGDGSLPPSINTDVAGSASKLAEVRSALLGDGTLAGTLSSSLVLALLVVYLLMCVLFQSFLRPLVIMFSVPLATLGGFLALFAVFLWSVNSRYMPMQSLDVLTMLGFVLLIGIVVNNAILIVHQTLNFMRQDAALPPRDAIREAVRTRVRPIFMGTLTSVGGMLPLVLMPGAGSELYRGLGSVVVGGLVVSTVFTLVLVPLVLGLVLRPGVSAAPGGTATRAE